MDLDALSAVRGPAWARLRALDDQRRLDGAEIDELIGLYQSVASDLSEVRSSAPDPTTVTWLSQLLARTRARFAGASNASWRSIVEFVMVTGPVALYRARWWFVGVTVISLVLAFISGWHVANDPAALAAMGTPSQRESYVNDMFASYYNPGAGFAGMVWTNNAWIAAQVIGAGITGILPVYVLVSNAVQVGATGGMMAHYGELGTFLKLISPHGLLELTAVFYAGAVGLKLFWTLIDPGRRTRGAALAQEGRAMITAAISLAGALALSGVVEGFVTGSHLLWWVKIIIGALALASFLTWMLVFGRRAVRDGHTGDLDAESAGYTTITEG